MNSLHDLHEAIFDQPIDVPVFNPVALELLQLVGAADTDFFKVISTIKEDQALSVQVLRMANSSSYIGRVSCDTIEKAAIRLGTHQIANLAIAASHASLHSSHDPLVNDIMQDLWLHSHACALGCRSLAAKTGNQRLADLAYMAGLLHDIGKLTILRALERIITFFGTNMTIEREPLLPIFEQLHVDMGCRVMDCFNIPYLYRQIVASHHQTGYPGSDALADTLLAIVRLVNFSSRKFQLNLYPTAGAHGDHAPEMTRLHIDENALARLEDIMTGCRQEISWPDSNHS